MIICQGIPDGETRSALKALKTDGKVIVVPPKETIDFDTCSREFPGLAFETLRYDWAEAPDMLGRLSQYLRHKGLKSICDPPDVFDCWDWPKAIARMKTNCHGKVVLRMNTNWFDSRSMADLVRRYCMHFPDQKIGPPLWKSNILPPDPERRPSSNGASEEIIVLARKLEVSAEWMKQAVERYSFKIFSEHDSHTLSNWLSSSNKYPELLDGYLTERSRFLENEGYENMSEDTLGGKSPSEESCDNITLKIKMLAHILQVEASWVESVDELRTLQFFKNQNFEVEIWNDASLIDVAELYSEAQESYQSSVPESQREWYLNHPVIDEEGSATKDGMNKYLDHFQRRFAKWPIIRPTPSDNTFLNGLFAISQSLEDQFAISPPPDVHDLAAILNEAEAGMDDQTQEGKKYAAILQLWSDRQPIKHNFRLGVYNRKTYPQKDQIHVYERATPGHILWIYNDGKNGKKPWCSLKPRDVDDDAG